MTERKRLQGGGCLGDSNHSTEARLCEAASAVACHVLLAQFVAAGAVDGEGARRDARQSLSGLVRVKSMRSSSRSASS
jgi:hypothetical protein